MQIAKLKNLTPRIFSLFYCKFVSIGFRSSSHIVSEWDAMAVGIITNYADMISTWENFKLSINRGEFDIFLNNI
ncbi:hypothetical protein VF14_23055 [Nostoc linckia z18]|jgi:hypothetical protein|uniref:Uncharacterized protein n=2 Tax=Nostoc linckia TaxID=92942 RepID=A0A9Q5Z639_NOSLI|nr:hypothetical protein VF02_17990 [Nostoc linckia z1]PHJ71971.1 hypothetical protein VF05_05235 [Nostoc linckia z3]PHJ77939.1 hypothetical protein VF03_02500 [Nostoc linckia z2]PHJ81394.1 hypothetical protein VF07_30360 [Nostoc linckia z6]PHJ84717.1 hypothetical protein VF06_08360 [Nostoc linckia z4]PHJ95487.1 hypothetical protein VF08_31900 [Nostoc linckia z8]PHJ95855.1 hypothetical protein VF04_17955 [Nostoc linckia z7]PHK08127.1 hypothetical protein VF09_21140 [Nostoc linckia z9]PHK1225